MSRETFRRNIGKVMSSRVVVIESAEFDTLTRTTCMGGSKRHFYDGLMRVDSGSDLPDNRVIRWSRMTV